MSTGGNRGFPRLTYMSWKATALGAALVLAACGGETAEGAPGAAPGGQGAARPASGGPGGGASGGRGGPAAVETGVASLGQISRLVTVSGTVSPIRTVAVNSQVSGALLSVLVQEGDTVREGRVLARVDDRELQAQLRSAEAAYEVAASALERSQQLRDRQVITQPEYERDRTAYEAARAQRDQLLTRAEFAEIRAPVAGVVTEKLVEQGDVVGSQSRLFALADISTMVVRVQVSELDVVELSPGQEVEVRLDARPGEVLGARILRVFPSADPATRLVPVEVALEERAARALARPGFLARVTFPMNPRDGAVLVPQSAVVARTGGQGVFIVLEDGTVSLRNVTVGTTYSGQVEIVSGLSPGERIVVTGASGLRDGGQVREVVRDGARVAPAPPGGGGGGGEPTVVGAAPVSTDGTDAAAEPQGPFNAGGGRE